MLIVIDKRSSILEVLVPQKNFAFIHSIITTRFLKHSVGFSSSFFELEAKFDADSLLLKIYHQSGKNIAKPLKHNFTKMCVAQECSHSTFCC
jgi:hypothetical protein